jgi:YVTN family beta-propeller protein
MKLSLAAPFLATLALACSTSEPSDGVAAFPDRRDRFFANGRTLGYVANQLSDTVSVLDLDTLSEIGSVPVGIDPVEIDGPGHVELDTERGFAYVLLTYPQSVVSAHAVASGVKSRLGAVQQLTLTDLAPVGEFHVDARAFDLAFSKEKQLLAVSHFDQDLGLKMTALVEERRAHLALVSPADEIRTLEAVVENVSICVVPAQVTFARNGERAFVACTGEDSLAVVDTQTATVLARVPAGNAPPDKPYSIATDPAGTRVLLSNQLSRDVVVFRTDDAPSQLFATIPLNGLPYTAGYVSDDAFAVPLQKPNGAALIEASTGVVRTQVAYTDAECTNPSSVRASAAGRVFMVCEGDHYDPGSVVELDPTTLGVVASVKVGLFPDRLAIREP